MTRMFDFYRGILPLGGLVADEKGLISSVVDGVSAPYTVQQKRLALPMDDLLRNHGSELTFFHPLRENIHQGESVVLSRFRKCVNITLNLKFQSILTDMFNLAASVSLHQKLNHEQTEFLTRLGGADEKKLETAFRDFAKIQEQMEVDNANKCYVHIHLRRRPKIAGREHNRGAIVNFPLYEEVLRGEHAKENEDKKIFGVTVSKTTRGIIRSVLEFVIKDVSKEGAYSVGSDANMSPFLVALIEANLKIDEDLQVIVERYEKFLTNKGLLTFERSWMEIFNNLGELYKESLATPMQPGNDGETKTAHAPAPAPVAPAPATSFHPAPNYAYTPPAPSQQQLAPVTANGKVDLMAVINQREMAAGYGQNWGGVQHMPPGAQAGRMNPPSWLNNGAPNQWQNNGWNGGGGGGPRI